ncbi:unnamed protein product [Moneuplotes crassus]|uniref:choline-phosphate cytidylyltransferase n=1 Tax=Euplotes crassus TaxID=5936 RepID=A0AAD1UQM3_EUPCR|nr:unnamed protein product [Moneuplotes crassus]
MPARATTRSKNGDRKGSHTQDPLDAEAKNRIHQLLDNVREQTKEKSESERNENGFVEGEDPDNPVRIYCDGVFDVFHVGHAKVLEQAKKMFKYVYLIVGVSGDEETLRLKGRTVMDEKERTESVEHCKWVDEVICPCPWIISVDFLEKHNIDYVAHDDIPYNSAGAGDIYSEIKKIGKFKATQRTDGISTSDLILRIIKDYDKYIWRSLDRGYTPKELGISQTKALRVKLKEKLLPMVNNSVGKVGKDITKTLDKWKKNSSHFVDHFIHQFDRDYKPKHELVMVDKAILRDDGISDFDY